MPAGVNFHRILWPFLVAVSVKNFCGFDYQQ